MRRQAGSHRLAGCFHHAVFDGWSEPLFLGEVVSFVILALALQGRQGGLVHLRVRRRRGEDLRGEHGIEESVVTAGDAERERWGSWAASGVRMERQRPVSHVPVGQVGRDVRDIPVDGLPGVLAAHDDLGEVLVEDVADDADLPSEIGDVRRFATGDARGLTDAQPLNLLHPLVRAAIAFLFFGSVDVISGSMG